jgi:SAM-dependent methyltransferase
MPRCSSSGGGAIAALHRVGERALRVVSADRARRGLLLRYRVLRHRGDRVECPVCGGRFRQFMSDWNRPGAICWRCGAHERHRALWLYLQSDPRLLEDVHSLLHISPEWSLQRRLRPLVGTGYVTSELEPGRADLALDLRAIALPNASFDAIVCSHVLEHIDEDAVAMRELHRVLRPRGWLIVMVPLDHGREHTFEDPSIQAPDERERAFWQHDHVRLYALDIVERLASAGFDVRRAQPAVECGPSLAARYGLLDGDDIFVCHKSTPARRHDG